MALIATGDVKIQWSFQLDYGGDQVLGYKHYIDSVLPLDTSLQSTLNVYTFYWFICRNYISVFFFSNICDIGESESTYLDLLATSVPQKP